MLLGVPTIHGKVTWSMYQNVIERIDKQLVGWNSKCLSLVERTTLIQLTIYDILAYVMQTTRLSRLISDENERKIPWFLWGSGREIWKAKPTYHLNTIKESRWAWVTRHESHKHGLLDEIRLVVGGGLDCLQARILLFKYCKGRELLHPQNQTVAISASNRWRGVATNLKHMHEAVGMMLGDSRTMWL